ncbi:MAG: hypothetical protein WA324_18285 [Bryobacteraceae bacterium]
MPFNLLLFPLLAGYLFIHTNRYLRWRAQTLDGNRLLLEAAKYGIVFGVAGRAATYFAPFIPQEHPAEYALHQAAPFDYSGTAVAALLLGIIGGPISNFFFDELEAKSLALRRQGNHLLRLLNEASEEGNLISVTLDTRKWYVGYVVETPSLDPKDQFFSIIPIFSGYRDTATLEACRLTEYRYDSISDVDAYAKVLNTSRVIDANVFDVDLYESYYAPGARNSSLPS